ncbi:MAG TPA: DUF507 family protein, partial [Verrucomicrobiae bacterium]|nr:DUF507 family protein [Verrucomicrobiae bacterium]
MRLKEEQQQRLADMVVTALVRDGHLNLKGERGAAAAAVKGAIAENLRQELELEREAERLLEQTLAATGGGSGIDR